MCDLAHVDADCWKDSPDAESVDQPFLARDLVRDNQGPYDEPHSLRKQDIPNRLRLHRSPTNDPVQRWRCRRVFAAAAVRGGVLRRLKDEMAKLDLHVNINQKPNEIPDPIPFDQDETHKAYDPVYANRFWRVLVQADRVFKEFRARFVGKCSPVHYFWGAPDLAVTRFSGRPAPEHPGGVPHLPDRVAREAYSHEVSSCGFWPGGGPVAYPVFYSYAYPEPSGFASAPVKPSAAFYSKDLREFILPYDVVRASRVAG